MILLLSVLACGRPDPARPPEIAWDRDACAWCTMLVSDPRHAAAIVTTSGATLPFDDPGCALHYLAERAPPMLQVWFHDADGWRTAEDVSFRTGELTPMGSGLLAVPRGTAGAIPLDEARRRVEAK
ncbi:MAG: hypothetical protein Q8P18_06055 [Pseudomonadota bacterium]|nr:hypothetical protein [Pseudomonadota bacterium]